MYFFIKIIHVVTAVGVLGVGFSNFVYFISANCQKDLFFLKRAIKKVIFIHSWLVGTVGFFQPISGFALIGFHHYKISYLWWFSVLGIYVSLSLCWLFGLYLLLRCQDLLLAVSQGESYRISQYHRSVILSSILALIAFSALIVTYCLMAGLSN